MDNLFDKLMACIFIESAFSLAKIEYVEEDYDFSTEIYIAHKRQGDYFIYLNVPEKLLPYVTNDIQIKLASLIKNGTDKFEQINSDKVKISSSFDKNATLIIVSYYDDSVKNDVMKQAILIEEDPYFFKKQVLSISTKELPIITSCFDEHKDNYIPYVQHLISDTGRFNEFTNSERLGVTDKGIEYSFVAKLYEKLPFLTLLVKESSQENLQQKIDSKLSELQRVNCDELLALDINKLDDWFAEIVKENVDD
ncbi:ABC-three component system middle component 1 [Moritella sp.]|uniref:ABC-three component system middle component 1 n=1 Tax=Moritella sp. TaxID=78556 RepID=UPI001D1E4108|nr:ABC-three component system middle component 1 [Moritella sp.]MCJ8348644.1 hypothetical protein [Moritella sp.]NQZ41249.1 hypothetical protein [Moritella sp.]